MQMKTIYMSSEDENRMSKMKILNAIWVYEVRNKQQRYNEQDILWCIFNLPFYQSPAV